MLFAKCEVMRSICWKGSPVNFIHLHNHVVSVFLCKKKKKKRKKKRREEKPNAGIKRNGLAARVYSLRGRHRGAAATPSSSQQTPRLVLFPRWHNFQPQQSPELGYSMLLADRTGETWTEKFISCVRLFLEVVEGGQMWRPCSAPAVT